MILIFLFTSVTAHTSSNARFAGLSSFGLLE